MRKRLLVIDDLAGTVQVICRVAEDLGFESFGFDNPSLAREAVAAFGPDVVVLGLARPDHDGIDLLLEIQSASRTVQIVLTSDIGEDYLHLAQGTAGLRGAARVVALPRPFRSADLVALFAGLAA